MITNNIHADTGTNNIITCLAPYLSTNSCSSSSSSLLLLLGGELRVCFLRLHDPFERQLVHVPHLSMKLTTPRRFLLRL